MLPTIKIEQTDEILKNFGNQMGLLGTTETHRALARAVNRVTQTVTGRVARAIAKQSSIKIATVKAAMRTQQVKPGSSQALEGKIIATGKPIPLDAFNAHQFKWGVKAKVWGRVQLFPGTFIYAGTPKSGQVVAGGHVFHRLTKAGLPIEMLFGPSVPEEMLKDESAKVFASTVADMLPLRVAHEIGRLLPK